MNLIKMLPTQGILKYMTQTNREMKVTEEHKEWMLEMVQIASKNEVDKYAFGFRHGVVAAIEKFGGIQWNKYPSVIPPQERTKVLVVMPDGSWREGIAKDGLLFVWLKNPGDWVRTLADYWAEINLPNQ